VPVDPGADHGTTVCRARERAARAGRLLPAPRRERCEKSTACLAYRTLAGVAPCTQRWAEQIGADACAEGAGDRIKRIDALLGR
jgi:hypothetical protein